MAVIGVNYDEGNKENLAYESVRLSYRNGEYIANSGDFVKDWYLAKKFYMENLADTELTFSQSSSVDHFIMDGAKFDSAFLVMDGNKPTLVYEYVEDGWEFFVPENCRWTFEELKAYANGVVDNDKKND